MPRPAPRAITSVCKTPTALLKNAIKNSFLPLCGCPKKGIKNGGQLSITAAVISPRAAFVSAARRYSVVRARLPAAIRARSRGAYHVARVYCFDFMLPPFQKVVCRQA